MPSPQHEAVVQMLENQERPDAPPTLQETRAGFETMAGLFGSPESMIQSRTNRIQMRRSVSITGQKIQCITDPANRLINQGHL